MLQDNTFQGRFTTPDMLWSAFPAHTPYHYAYNSPMTYRDPSGLAPETENEGEELMGLFDWTEIEEGLGSVSRFIASLQNSIYDAGGVSNYAKEPKGGSRKGGSTSSANNGQGGQGAEGSSIFNIIIDFVVDLVTLNIFAEEELNAPVYKIEEVVVYADREQVLPEANWWDFVVERFTWDNRTVNIGGKEYLVDRNGYARGILAPSTGTPPDVGFGKVGKAGKVVKSTRILADALIEQMAMEVARKHKGIDITNKILGKSGKLDFGDDLFSINDGWRKYQVQIDSKYGQKAIVHYWYNINSGIKKGFKFID